MTDIKELRDRLADANPYTLDVIKAVLDGRPVIYGCHFVCDWYELSAMMFPGTTDLVVTYNHFDPGYVDIPFVSREDE